MESFRFNATRAWNDYQSVLRDLKIGDPRPGMSVMTYRLRKVTDDDGVDIGARAWRHASRNFTMQGLVNSTFLYGPGWKPADLDHAKVLVREFRKIVPHSEVGLRMAIQAAQDAKLEELRDWEGKLTEDPVAYQVIGDHYVRLGDPASAKRCYQKSLDMLPQYPAAYRLANLYWRQDDLERWEQTYLDFLESEDLGLAHAEAHRALAFGFRLRGEWQQAKPHAVAAGETWSGWGLEIASQICEGLAEWEESENWIREMSVSYPTYSGNAWYFWCRRTGRGDLEAASELADEFFATPTDGKNRYALIRSGAYWLLEGDLARSRESYRAALTFRPSLSCTCMIAQLSERLDDVEGKTQAIEQALAPLQQVEEPTEFEQFAIALLEFLQFGDASDE
ncbi:MAG: hypothetical protein AAF961_17920, partial [Planctomycetota bacterium]